MQLSNFLSFFFRIMIMIMIITNNDDDDMMMTMMMEVMIIFRPNIAETFSVKLNEGSASRKLQAITCLFSLQIVLIKINCIAYAPGGGGVPGEVVGGGGVTVTIK